MLKISAAIHLGLNRLIVAHTKSLSLQHMKILPVNNGTETHASVSKCLPVAYPAFGLEGDPVESASYKRENKLRLNNITVFKVSGKRVITS